MTEHVPVVSSDIASVAHDSEEQIMEVRFTNGKLYRYAGVTSEKHADLMKAKSVGSHFARHIRDLHFCVKVDTLPIPAVTREERYEDPA